MPTSPATPSSRLAEADRLLRAGDAASAARICRQVVKRRPIPAALIMLGAALARQGKHAEGRKHLLRARQIQPDNPQIAFELASSYQAQERLDDALEAIDAVLSSNADDPRLLRAKAELLRMSRRYQEAHDLLLPFAEAEGADVHILIAFGTVASRVGEARRAVELLGPRADDGALADQDRRHLLFTLAAALEKTGDSERAFDALTKANALKPARYDPDKFTARVDRLIAAWTPEAIATLPRGDDSDLPVFIVGMPRSGTSLVEQILGSHPRVHACGELNEIPRFVLDLNKKPAPDSPFLDRLDLLSPGAVSRFARRYLGDRRKEASAAGHAGAERVTDKLPLNGLHLGVIATLFPNARVILCRRDPLDTCLSCYMHDFGGNLLFAYDLEHLGRFHRDYDRLLDHWSRALPLALHEAVYEDLVTELEPHARTLVDFLGLPWDDACLRFHESERIVRTVSQDQVRQRVYTSSIGRWKNFEPWLGPLQQALSNSRLE